MDAYTTLYRQGKGNSGPTWICFGWDHLYFLKFFLGLPLEGNQVNVRLTSGSPTNFVAMGKSPPSLSSSSVKWGLCLR